MGGDMVSSSDEEETPRPDFSPELSYESTNLLRGGLSTKVKNGVKYGDNELSSTCLDLDCHQRRERRVYEEILQSFDDMLIRSKDLNEAISRILSYKPGSWAELAEDINLSDYDVPKMTTLLLVGPKGSGKSSLINRILRAFNDDKFIPDRAQVSHTTSGDDGTYFLQEHIIRGSNSFCLYDTRGLSDVSVENIKMMKRWMTKGVCHGELLTRTSDDSSVGTRMKYITRKSGYDSSRTRVVNFVIFVVNGLSVLKSMEGDEVAGRQYNQTIATSFNLPYLSFRDDKPVIVVTHGDLLSLSERARVRAHLGELLSIPPVKQIFDIPDRSDPVTDLAILDVLRYSLQHSDRNFPYRPQEFPKVCTRYLLQCTLVLLIFMVAVGVELYLRRALEAEPDIKWHKIRHLW